MTVNGTVYEYVYWPEQFENLNGVYRFYDGEKITGSGDWDKGQSIMLDAATGKWTKFNTTYGTSSPWFVDEDVDDDATEIVVHEQPYIRLMPPMYHQKSLQGILVDENNLIGDYAETNSSFKYDLESTKIKSASLLTDWVVTPGTKGYICFDSNAQQYFIPQFSSPLGYQFRSIGIATSSASKKGETVSCIMSPNSVYETISSVYEGEKGNLRFPMTIAEVTGSYNLAIPISGGGYVAYTNNDILFEHPFIYQSSGTRLAEMPKNDLFKESSNFLCSPVFIFKSRTEALISTVNNYMSGLSEGDSGFPIYNTDTLTIPSFGYFSNPNTVTRDYLRTLQIACNVPDGAIPAIVNPGGEIKSIVWDFGHRGIAIPCTNDPLEPEEDIDEFHKLNFYKGEQIRIITASLQYRGIDVSDATDGTIVRDRGLVHMNIMKLGAGSDKYFNPYVDDYTNNYFLQLRNGSIKGMGYVFAGNTSYGLTGINSASIATRHGSNEFWGTAISREGMASAGSFVDEGAQQWWRQFMSSGDRLLPDCHKDAFIGPRDYNGSPITINWSGTVKEEDKPFYPDHGNIFKAFPMYAEVWKNFSCAQPFPYDVRKIKTRLVNLPLGLPESEMTFESSHLFHYREENETAPAITKSNNGHTILRVKTDNSSYVYGIIDEFASYGTGSSRIGTLDFRGPFSFCRGLFWIEEDIPGSDEVIKYYCVENNIVSKYPIYKYGTCWSPEIPFDKIGSRTQRNWSYGFTSLPGNKIVKSNGKFKTIHYKIDFWIDMVDYSLGNYAIGSPESFSASTQPVGYLGNSPMWSFSGTIF